MIQKIKRCFSLTRKIIAPFNINMYLVNCGTECIIIDPGEDFHSIQRMLSHHCPNSKPSLFLTHGHYNHIQSVPQICDHYKNTTIFASAKDLRLFLNPFNHSKNSINFSLKNYIKKMKFVKEHDILKFGDSIFEIIELSGHTPGSIGLYSKAGKCAFVGDTLQFESLGSVDHPQSNDKLLIKNIRMKLLTLDEKTKIYPGHGRETSIAHEKENNPFLKHPFFGDATNMSLFEPLPTDFLIHCV